MPVLDSQTIRLAVLPLLDAESDVEEGYFIRGFAEDLVADLSRFPNLELVSSRASAGVEHDGLSDAALGLSLSLDYLLKLTLRRRGEQIRLHTQLVDPPKDVILWAERYDVPQEEVFQLQDEIVQKAAAALCKNIDAAALRAARRKPLTELAAYDCWLRGLDLLREGSLASDEKARECFHRAIEADPHYGRAYAGLSLSYFNEWSCQRWDRWDDSERCAFQNALESVRLDPNDHISNLVLGRVFLYRRDFDRAKSFLDRALAINPTDPDLLIQNGTCQVFLGEFEQATRLYERALILNPHPEPYYFGYGAFIHFAQKRFEEAIGLSDKMLDTPVFVDSFAYLSAALAHNGDLAKAASYKERFLETFREKITSGRSPAEGEAMRWLRLVNPFRFDEHLEILLEGLRLTGLSDDRKIAQPLPFESQDHAALLSQCAFHEVNGMRQISFEGKGVLIPEIKGYRDIAVLLSKPGEEVHCAELMGNPVNSFAEDEVLDGQARRAIQTRIRELQADLAEAEEHNDVGRTEACREELDSLLEHLGKAVGLGGRARKLGSSGERARTAVTWRIRSAIRKLKTIHPALHRHLENSVRTGTFCSYSPEKSLRWTL